jgi:hypothetical protein
MRTLSGVVGVLGRSMRITHRWVALLGVLDGCYHPSPQEGAPCQSSAQCPTPQRCFLGSCRLSEPPMIDASQPEPDAAIDAPPPPIDAPPPLACSTTGLTCSMPPVMLTCGGKCWVLCEQNIVRTDAQARCTAWMGSLGQIDDGVEQDCVDNVLAGQGTWIGLVQDSAATTPGAGWTWNGVAPVVYTHWLSGKPDDGGDGENRSEQCASMRTDGLWDDNSCGQTLDFLCERPM